ncbi:MAG: thiolase family protein [Salinarimonas sp.]
MSYIVGAGLTPFSRDAGADTLALMSRAAQAALDDAGLSRGEIDGLVTGYATTMPHLMLATVFAEHFGVKPHYAHAIQLGGATGAAMLMLAHGLVQAGMAQNILVVAGENRASGATRDDAIRTLAQVGHPRMEAPLGATVPGYYALLASRYMHEFNVTESDLAAFTVVMRDHAARTPGAHRGTSVTEAEVLASRPIATPLKLLDCCPVSDGAAAFIIAKRPGEGPALRIIGCGQAHQHQHISELADIADTGAAASAARAFAQAGIVRDAIGYAAIYDSFSITLCMLLEELGFVPRGQAGAAARAGMFSQDGDLPLNTHGGLLGYGHCGVAGAMAHLVEARLQMTGRAGARQGREADFGLFHGDGGVMSSHVSLILERVR